MSDHQKKEMAARDRERMLADMDLVTREEAELAKERAFKDGFTTGWDLSRNMLGHYIDADEGYDIYMRGRRRIKG